MNIDARQVTPTAPQQRLKQLIGNLVSQICLPQQCQLCHTLNKHLICCHCQPYLAAISHHLSPHRCQLCASPLPTEDTSIYVAKSLICGNCLTQPPHYQKCLCAYDYSDPVSQLIHQFKDAGQLGIGNYLSEQLAQHLTDSLTPDDKPDAITYTPLHWRKQLNRGFNQSKLIANVLGKHLDIPVISTLKKIQATQDQHQLNRKQRLRNLKHCFAFIKPQTLPTKIALVDDVITTGATANTLSRLLRLNGATHIQVWSLAHTNRRQ